MRTAKTGPVVLAMLLIAATIQAQDEPDRSEPLNLRGTIMRREVFGPPGFGETPATDQRLAIYVLTLDTPETFEELLLTDIPNRLRGTTQQEVQLTCRSGQLPDCDALLAQAAGDHVWIHGRSSFAIYPSDYLPVLVELEDLQPEPEPGAEVGATVFAMLPGLLISAGVLLLMGACLVIIVVRVRRRIGSATPRNEAYREDDDL